MSDRKYESPGQKQAREQAADAAAVETAAKLAELKNQLDKMQAETAKAEQEAETARRKQIIESRIWQSIIVLIALLTLGATIFGALMPLCTGE